MAINAPAFDSQNAQQYTQLPGAGLTTDLVKFKGFGYNIKTTPTPNILYDVVLGDKKLSHAACRVMFYITRRVFGFNEKRKKGEYWDAIAYEQFTGGIVTKEGKRLDDGCGVSERWLKKALEQLEELDYIFIHRGQARRGGVIVYEINIDGRSHYPFAEKVASNATNEPEKVALSTVKGSTQCGQKVALNATTKERSKLKESKESMHGEDPAKEADNEPMIACLPDILIEMPFEESDSERGEDEMYTSLIPFIQKWKPETPTEEIHKSARNIAEAANQGGYSVDGFKELVLKVEARIKEGLRKGKPVGNPPGLLQTFIKARDTGRGQNKPYGQNTTRSAGAKTNLNERTNNAAQDQAGQAPEPPPTQPSEAYYAKVARLKAQKEAKMLADEAARTEKERRCREIYDNLVAQYEPYVTSQIKFTPYKYELTRMLADCDNHTPGSAIEFGNAYLEALESERLG